MTSRAFQIHARQVSARPFVSLSADDIHHRKVRDITDDEAVQIIRYLAFSGHAQAHSQAEARYEEHYYTHMTSALHFGKMDPNIFETWQTANRTQKIGAAMAKVRHVVRVFVDSNDDSVLGEVWTVIKANTRAARKAVIKVQSELYNNINDLYVEFHIVAAEYLDDIDEFGNGLVEIYRRH